ncbi:hypothetical protein OAA67_04875 [Winogradskyella sp.]|nr:hypothetical protein [Winogradskyella sp.]
MDIKDKNQITRKEALKKMGKYAAVTAVGTFIVLNPMKSQAATDTGAGTGNV